MSTVITTEEYKGFTIEIGLDEHAENPRTTSDNVGKLVLNHRRYDFGDENVTDMRKHLLELANYDYEWLQQSSGQSYKGSSMYTTINEVNLNHVTILNRIEKSYVILPVYMYDHSGITIKTTPFGCAWDSGLVGFIYVSKEAAKKEFSDTKQYIKKAKKYLEGEIETLDQYLTGDVKYYKILNSEGEEIESCYDYYSETDFVLNEAKATINCLVK